MTNPRPPARPPATVPATPQPHPDPLDNCTTCGNPIDVESDVWITLGAGVDAGVEHVQCR